MKYTIRTTSRFDREFKKLDRYTKLMIKGWIDKHLTDCDNPRAFGKGLTADQRVSGDTVLVITGSSAILKITNL